MSNPADRVSRVIFEAVDNTAAGVASVNKSTENVSKSADAAAKKLTEAEGAGKGFASSVGQAFKAASAQIKEATSGTSTFVDGAKALGGALKSALIPATAAAAAFTAAISFGDKIATESYAAERATARLQVSIEGARKAFGGYVSDMQLAQVANKGFALGVVNNGKELERLSRGVAAIAEDLGGDTMELLDSAIVGIGRKSTAVLDNLGIILTQSQAEEEYAASLGKTVSQLTAYEKSQAFAKMAIERVAEAARDGAKANDSYAESWQKGKVALENWIDAGYGFDAIGGRIRETLRDMDAEVLELFGTRDQVNIAKINRLLKESGLTYEQIRDYVIETNNIETMRGGQQNREQRLQTEKALVDLAGEALRHQEKEIKNQERLAAEAEREAKAKADAEAVAALDHEVAVLQAIGAKEKEIVAAQEAALLLRIEQAEAAGDLAAQVELERKLELLLLGTLFKKNKARGRGITIADRERASADIALKHAEDEIRLLELRAELSGQAQASEIELLWRRQELELDRLDAERRVLELTRAKNSLERETNAARLEAIDREMEILALEHEVAARKEVNRLIAEAVALSTERAQQDANAARRAAELAALQRDDEQARLELAAEVEKRHTQSALRRLDIERNLDGELARLQRKRIEDQRRATEAELDAREAALRAQVGGDALEQERRQDEFRQLAHDREIARLDYEMQIRRSMEAEKQAMLAAEQQRFDVQMQQLHDGLSTFEGLQAQTTQLTSFLVQRSREAADADFRHTIAMMEQKGAAQRDALQREIDAASGNIALQNKLRRQQAAQEEAMRKQIALAQAKHQDKIKRQEMRSAGWQMAIVSITEGIKALAAAAAYNIPQALLHGAASTAAGVQAGLLLSGKIPGGGAVAALSAGGGSMAMGSQPSQEYADPSNVPGSVPGKAAERESSVPRTRPDSGTGGTTVVVNGDINAWGSIDKRVTEDLARAIGKVGYGREI